MPAAPIRDDLQKPGLFPPDGESLPEVLHGLSGTTGLITTNRPYAERGTKAAGVRHLASGTRGQRGHYLPLALEAARASPEFRKALFVLQ